MVRKSVEKMPTSREHEETLGRFAGDYPKTVEYLEKTLNIYKEHTSKISESADYPKEFKKLVKEMQGKFKQRGYEMLVSTIKGKDIRSEMTVLCPAKKPAFSENNLANLREIKKIASGFAERGLEIVMDRYEELFKGKERAEINKNLFKKSEELIKKRESGGRSVKDRIDRMKESIPRTASKEEAEEILTAMATSAEVVDFIKINNVVVKLEGSLRAQALKQYIKKIKEELPEDKIAEVLAVSETFLDLLDSGIEAGLKISDTRVKANLINDFSGLLDKKIINDIISKRKEIVKKIKWEKDNLSFYA